ncbi:MAG TPA: DUF2062 domain-containing protein [Vicinamibacteria bacterium]|nr:DUF2062 domain-containing protein [Vicinamibacteria bacterium]
MRAWLGRLRLLLQLEGSPDRIALSFAVGIFIAFFPLLGIHTGLALALALAFRLNKVAILTGAWVNNPWTLAPMYTAGTLLGCALVRVSPASVGDVDWSLHGQAFYHSLIEGFRPLLLPFVVGNLVTGAAAGLVTYFLLRKILVRRRGLPGTPGHLTET